MTQRKGFMSKDLIVTLVVAGIIGALGITYLFNANAARNAAEEKNDLATTFTTMYEKAKANGSEDEYSLNKLFKDGKVYDINKKTYLKNIAGKKLDTNVAGIATYTNGTSLDVTSDLSNLTTNEVGVIFATSYDITDAGCVDKTGTAVGKDFLTIEDTAHVDNQTKDSVCRGAADGDENKHIIYVVKDGKTAEKMNQKLFDNEGKTISLSDGTNTASGVVLNF